MILEKKTHNKYKLTLDRKKHLLKFGQYGFKSTGFASLSKNKLDTLNFLILRKLKLITSKKNYKLWSLLVLNKNLTKLSSESRMGKGKGNVYTKSIFIKPGTILFEFDNIDKKSIFYLYNYIKKKLSFKLNLIINN